MSDLPFRKFNFYLVFFFSLAAKDIAYVGLRDVDPGER
jgi:hypothetical protein